MYLTQGMFGMQEIFSVPAFFLWNWTDSCKITAQFLRNSCIPNRPTICLYKIQNFLDEIKVVEFDGPNNKRYCQYAAAICYAFLISQPLLEFLNICIYTNANYFSYHVRLKWMAPWLSLHQKGNNQWLLLKLLPSSKFLGNVGLEPAAPKRSATAARVQVLEVQVVVENLVIFCSGW
jgi:hypothetical protein